MKQKPAKKAPVAPGRRRFIRKAAYTAPVIMSLTAMPAMAQSGSGGNTDPDDRDES